MQLMQFSLMQFSFTQNGVYYKRENNKICSLEGEKKQHANTVALCVSTQCFPPTKDMPEAAAAR